MNATCIWCKQSRGCGPPEHIVPEVLGCPPELILRQGEVCAECNHGFGHLDAILAHAFDAFRVFAGQPGKRGKKPRITSRANLRGETTSYGADFVVNAGPHPVDDPRYGRINPPRGKASDARSTFKSDGATATITIRVTLGDTPKFARAIHKIALEYLALVSGAPAARSSVFDPVREFVILGRGSRRVIVTVPSSPVYEHRFGNVRLIEQQHWCVDFVLCGVPFFVDLSPDQTVQSAMKDYFARSSPPGGWTLLPPTEPTS